MEFLGYALATTPFVMAFIFAMLLCVLTVGAYGNAAVGTGLMAAAYWLTTALGNAGLNLGISLYVPDLVLALIGLVVLIRLLTGKFTPGDTITRAWIILGVVWFGLFVVGVPLHKTLAGVAFRQPFYVWVAVAYLLSFRLDLAEQHRVLNVLIAASIAMAGLVVFRWTEIALDLPDLAWRESSTSIRVVPSAAAQLLALAMTAGLAGLVGLSRFRPGIVTLALLYLAILVFLQHRTVWVVMLTSIAAAVWLARRARLGHTAGALVPLLAAAALVSTLAVVAPESTVTRGLQSSAQEIGQQKSTFNWRLDSWRELISDWAGGGPQVWPFGRPFGSEMRRYIATQQAESTVSAHSNYVGLLVNGGLIGLVAFLVAQIVALKRLVSSDAGQEAHGLHRMYSLFILAMMVYAVAYGVEFVHALFLGLSYGVAARMPKTAKADAAAATLSIQPRATVAQTGALRPR